MHLDVKATSDLTAHVWLNWRSLLTTCFTVVYRWAGEFRLCKRLDQFVDSL